MNCKDLAHAIQSAQRVKINDEFHIVTGYEPDNMDEESIDICLYTELGSEEYVWYFSELQDLHRQNKITFYTLTPITF